MEDSSKEELLQLLKRFGAYLTVKMSNLFSISLNNLNSLSSGTVAGLAIAMVLTWRLLRTPGGNQRRQPKRGPRAPGGSGVNTHLNVPALDSSGVSSASEDFRAQNVIDELVQPVKPTLAQIVRRKLNDGRKVTCQMLGVILEESSPEQLQKQATVRSSVLEVLMEISKCCDIYLMERILDDESGEKVLSALEETGVFASGGLMKDKRMDDHLLLGNWNQIGILTQILKSSPSWIDSSDISFTFLQADMNIEHLTCSIAQA